MGFFKQEYQSGFPCSPSGVFLTQGLNSCLLHVSSALQADSLPLSHQGTPLLYWYFCLENSTNSLKRQKDRTLKDELPRSVGAQYATGHQWRNNPRKNEETKSKEKQHPAVDVTDDGSKVRCCKEQYCIGTWNVRSMNQGKFSSVQFSRSLVSDSL